MARWTKKLAMLLAVVMLFSVLPMTALATQAQGGGVSPDPVSWTERETISREEMMKLVALVPLENKNVTVDLTDLTPPELRKIPISKLLEGQDVDPNAAVAWSVGHGDDDYTVTDMNGYADILENNTYSSNRNVSLIVGSAKQLDTTNTHYVLDVKVQKNLREWLVPTLYVQAEDGSRSNIPVSETDYYSWDSWESGSQMRIAVSSKVLYPNQPTYLSLSLNPVFSDRFDSVQVLLGDEEAVANGTAADITAQIWNVDMTATDAGYYADLSNYEERPELTLILKRGEQEVARARFDVYLYLLTNYVSGFMQTADGDFVARSIYETNSGSGDVAARTFELDAKYPVSAQYNLRFSFYQEREQNNDAVEMAVLGDYATKEDAVNAGAADIKEELFNGKGHLADYSGGVNFTVFADGEVFRLLFQTKDGAGASDSDIPEQPGSSDTSFRIAGATEVDYSDTYVIPYEHDTYYYHGYQTVLILDEDADMSQLTPEFWSGEKETIYAGTPSVAQKSEESVQNFANGPVQYTAAAEDRESRKEYVVTYAQKSTGGSKLFVNGTNGPQNANGIRRELFLNSWYGNAHDIFIANLGDAPLTGLKAELTDARNVKLDDYWTVGGERNDTLAAFTTTYSRYDGYSELPNVAKIRLLPNGDGDISGTLTISADGQTPVNIALTGVAGDPTITTTTIPAGVKYVPYGTMIQTTNMYDWNKLTFTKVSGDLPKGVEVRPNGEIYGVPQETGSFTFRVRMENSVHYFDDVYATYTLEVLDNTSDNVEAATDVGYAITKRVPDMKTYSDQTFEIEGELSEFMDLWLDGQKLVRDMDYTAEQGSTKGTIFVKTFQNQGTGTHTLAGEYRVNGDINNELKKAAQNYTVGGTTKPASKSTSQSTTITPTAAVQPGTTGTYTVQWGDNLSCIALNYYGSYAYSNALYRANADSFKATKGVLEAGMTLVLPERLGKAVRLNAPVAGDGEILYTVKAGDTLGKIARAYYGNINRYKDIFERNQDRLKNANTIFVGQIIVLPAK